MRIIKEYKPPSSKDIPIDFRVELLRDAPNPVGVLGSKGSYYKLEESD
jgi:xanthine dehydrogenase/oxidase